MPAALLFDLDGTLVDSARDIAAALSTLRAERGGDPVAADAVRPLVSLGAETLVARGMAEYARDPGVDLAAFRCALAGIAPCMEAIYPGVRSALHQVRALGYALAVVTNKPERLSVRLLRTLALDDLFDVVVGGDTLPVCKPDPAPLFHAMRLLDARPDQSFFIGDSMVDARAASSASLPFLLFEGGYGGIDAHAVTIQARFARYEQLPGLLPSGGLAPCATKALC